MSAWRVTWIDKPGGSYNPHTRIQRLGGPGWQNSEDGVISNILWQVDSYYVERGGTTVYLMVGWRGTRPYLKTRDDGTPLDNLLSLPNISLVV